MANDLNVSKIGKTIQERFIEKGLIKPPKNTPKNKTKKAKVVEKKEPSLYIGNGSTRIEFVEGKEKEIRDMLSISNKFTLGKYAKVKKAEYIDLLAAGLAHLTEGQKKIIAKSLPKTTIKDGRIIKEIELPKLGKSVSQFAKEIADELKTTNSLFYRVDQKEIVEVGKIKDQKTGEELYTGFIPIEPNRFITTTEEYIAIGQKQYNKETEETIFKIKSMKRETAQTVLQSKIMQEALPQIKRIFTTPIPIIENGKLTFPKKGYDERFCSWLPYDASEITKTEMGLEKAKDIIKEMLSEFCFQSKQDYYNAIAALLTPFVRGLFPKFNTRTPVFFYLGNRPRTGKDYLAGITGLLYEGNALEEPPINSTENKANTSEELRKKVLAAMITGRKRLHFSNNKGYIDNVILEAISTTEKFSDRVLGKSEILTFDNELDFSLSGNAGISYTPDFAARCRFVRLFLDIEDANAREFKKPNLHEWVLENKSEILSAFFALVKNWVDTGQPKGSLPFASYHIWAETIGGIMEMAGYGNPCEVDKESLVIGGDLETSDMKELFETFYARFPDDWVERKTIMDFVIEESGLFGYLRLDEVGGKTKLGLAITKFTGRVLSDIRLVVADKKKRPDRQKMMFTKKKREEPIEDIFAENAIKPKGTAEQADLKNFDEKGGG